MSIIPKKNQFEALKGKLNPSDGHQLCRVCSCDCACACSCMCACKCRKSEGDENIPAIVVRQ